MDTRHVLLTAVLSVGGLGLVASPAWAGDKNKSDSSQGISDAASQTDDSASSAGQSVDGTSSSSSDLSDSAVIAGDKQPGDKQHKDYKKDKHGSVSKSEARQVLSQTVNAALAQGQFQDLNQHLSQADQQRLGDLSDQGQQLDQSIQQLRQAYRDKFNSDLDLSQNADQIFTAQFFQIGGEFGDQARAAGATESPDSESAIDDSADRAVDDATSDATAQTESTDIVTDGVTADASPDASSRQDSADDAGLADQAQTAGSTTGGQRTSITVPGSQTSESVRINLVQEGGQWKVDLPDNTDGRQLAQNLQRHIDMAIQQKDQWADQSKAQQEIARHVLMAFGDTSGSDASGASGASSVDGASGRTDSPSNATDSEIDRQ